MKQQIIILSLIAIIFSGCSKVDNNELAQGDPRVDNNDPANTFSATGSSNLQPIAPAVVHPANITVHLQPLTGGNTLFQWQTGYLNINSLMVDGCEVVDGMKQRLHFEAKVDGQVNMLTPSDPGAVIVSGLNYNVMYAGFVLTPPDINKNSKTTANESAALYLDGLYLGTKNDIIPVRILIDQQVEMVAEWHYNMAIVENHNYTSHLFLNLANITKGITYDMMRNARSVTDGMVIISSTTNNNLYQIVLSNLHSSLTTQFL